MATRRRDPDARRSELIEAAARVFREKGVANATVADVVRAARVAQGTFYLYFSTKADVVDAVVEQMVGGMVEAVERAVAATGADAVAKLLALRDAMVELAGDAAGRELAELYHRPENRAVHDRMADRITARLAPLVEAIVRQGVEERAFVAPDPRLAAYFVLGGLHMAEAAAGDRTALPAAIRDAADCALRALGHEPRSRAARGGRRAG